VQAGVVLDTDGLNQGNGSIRLEGATVTIEGGPALSASKTGKGFFGDAGSVRLRSTAGDCTLAGRFSATGGNGIIEADATGNLTATGAFRAASDGCIALRRTACSIRRARASMCRSSATARGRPAARSSTRRAPEPSLATRPR